MAGTARFIQLLGTGKGEYTAERRQRPPRDGDVKTVAEAIENAEGAGEGKVP